jgi:hypothetical protein
VRKKGPFAVKNCKAVTYASTHYTMTIDCTRTNGVKNSLRVPTISWVFAEPNGRTEKIDLARKGKSKTDPYGSVRFLSYGTIFSHSPASERATTATTGSASLRLNTSWGTPGSM